MTDQWRNYYRLVDNDIIDIIIGPIIIIEEGSYYWCDEGNDCGIIIIIEYCVMTMNDEDIDNGNDQW